MIVTEIYNGQGLGNQLWCYIVTRVIALDNGYDFGIKSPEKFSTADINSFEGNLLSIVDMLCPLSLKYFTSIWPNIPLWPRIKIFITVQNII